MATIKSHTDLPQSKKLAEFLPLESADMYYDVDSYGVRTTPEVLITSVVRKKDVPCWSLAALLSVIRKTIGYEVLCLDRKNITIKCELGDEPWNIEINKDNEVDACVDMIIKIHEQKLL